jgi:serine/threonine protein kinase
MTTVKINDDRELTIRDRVYSGDISDIFDGTLAIQSSTVAEPAKVLNRYERILARESEYKATPVLVKIAKQEYFNDLIEMDASVLSRIHPEKVDVRTKLWKYYPTSYGSVLVEGKQAHILEPIPGCVTLADVLKAYPDGIDYRDMAWMFKRILVGIWYAHRRGIIHGAILPPHILLTLGDHGGRIIDWSYSTSPQVKVPAMVTDYEDYYPPEVMNSEPSRESTDLYMLTKCVQALLGADLKTKEFPDSVPDPIRGILGLCLNDSAYMRPVDASDVHDTFDKLMKEAVGKSTFRHFELPGPV